MEYFSFRDSGLFCEGVALAEIADQFGTPTYVYSRAALTDGYARLANAFGRLNPRICFSIKSCHNLHVLKLLREQGASFDAVSIGEVRRAIEAGAAPQDVVFAGVGKTPVEIAEAIRLGVGCFNVESEQELEALATEARHQGRAVRAALRVNPDVDAHTHPLTTTGKSENKFGIDVPTAERLFAAYSDGGDLRLCGIHVHIGSPVNTVSPYVETVERVLELVGRLRSAGVEIELLNLGGGWSTPYTDEPVPALDDYAAAIVPLLADQGFEVHLEPGRSIAANAGVLLARTVYVKEGLSRRFVIVDAAMTDLIRPALYEAFHFVWPVAPQGGLIPPAKSRQVELPGLIEADVVGPVCESSDYLAKGRRLPPIDRGELLAVFSAGAYGMVMSSQYNSRPRAAEVLVDGEQVRLVRRRETYDDLVAAERDV